MATDYGHFLVMSHRKKSTNVSTSEIDGSSPEKLIRDPRLWTYPDGDGPGLGDAMGSTSADRAIPRRCAACADDISRASLVIHMPDGSGREAPL
jgi:hypothetical protein